MSRLAVTTVTTFLTGTSGAVIPTRRSGRARTKKIFRVVTKFGSKVLASNSARKGLADGIHVGNRPPPRKSPRSATD